MVNSPISTLYPACKMMILHCPARLSIWGMTSSQIVSGQRTYPHVRVGGGGRYLGL